MSTAPVAIKERSILFKADMVNAILAGRKTMTRRDAGLKAINERPYDFEFVSINGLNEFVFSDKTKKNKRDEYTAIACPYGLAGDRLWVRETWSDASGSNGQKLALYQATYRGHSGISWTPSIFMPRWASRIDLEITDVRVERLEGISEADAKAEGCTTERTKEFGIPGEFTAKLDFMMIWDSIHGKHASHLNPWLWVISFKRLP